MPSRQRLIQLTRRGLVFAFYFLLLSNVLARSTVPPGDQHERIRAFARDVEFNFVTWTLDAVGLKFGQIALGVGEYIPQEGRSQTVLDYLDLIRNIHDAERRQRDIYADPDILDKQSASALVNEELAGYNAERDWLEPLAESILQDQISIIVAEMGLTLGGQPIPPVLFHSTPLTYALIVSPRDAIQQDANISLIAGLSLEDRIALEEQVDAALDMSSLVVGIGGVGSYPTMVTEATNINWLAEVVSHEWIHNYLTIRPLGWNYFTAPELTTMNETTAAIAGKEIGAAVISRFYPEFVPPPPPPPPPENETDDSEPLPPPAFDYRAEMHITRLHVDELLAQGKIEEAEAYMELRRRFFWDHGYTHLRKINQAYFAFYGSYADSPVGAAGTDPVGAAVRDLRAQSDSLADFLFAISWMSSFEQLQLEVGR